MIDTLIQTAIKEGVSIVSDLIKKINAKKVENKIEENQEEKKEKNPRYKIETSEISNSLSYHLETVRKWSNEISFRDLNNAKKTHRVYVKLDFYLTPKKLQLEEEKPQINLDQIFNTEERHIIILGQPGAGKTTSMKYLSQEILKGKFKNEFNLPIVIRLRELPNKKIKSADGEQFITIHLLEKILEITGIQLYAKNISQKTDNYELVKSSDFEINLPLIKKLLIPFIDSLNALIIFDGLDEVSINNKNRIIEQVRELTMNLSKSKIILTSRSGDFDYNIENSYVYEISPLSKSQIKEFSIKWLSSKVESDKFYSQLLKSPYSDTAIRPLTLAHLCTIYEKYQKIPEKPKTIYRKIVNLLIEEWDLQRSIIRKSKYSKFEVDRKFEFLSNLSYDLTTTHQTTVFSHSDFIDAYHNICDNFDIPYNEAKNVAKELESHTGLFFKSSYEKYEFSHKSIQEYLASEHLAKLPSIPYSPIILIIPNELAIALTLSSNPTIYFASLIFENFRKHEFSQTFIDTFFSRLLIEKPDFSIKPLWALTFLKLFTIAYNNNLDLKLFDSLADLKNSKISIKNLNEYYRKETENKDGIIEIKEFKYLDNNVFSDTPKKLYSKSKYLIEWKN